MERTTVEEARLIFRDHFIGEEELRPFLNHLHSSANDFPGAVPEIPWDKETLVGLADQYLLVLGVPVYGNVNITIRNLRGVFGTEPDKFQPCFYNQDWYLKEDFIDATIAPGWYLIRKSGLYESRGVDPDILLKKDVKFPEAILTCYTFFAYWFCRGEILWEYDFVWCSDRDHNGDRIYVGKYTDIDGVNKSGFSIHRHLALRPCYTAINLLS